MPSVDERTLLKLKHEGRESDLIDYRLRHEALQSTIKYLVPLMGKERVHPRYLPTQKSGRWSITGPPLPTFSDKCINPECTREDEHMAGGACWSLRDVVVPDEGWYFLHFDWSAIEAKLAAAYSGDDEDLELFARDADIHTVTYCKMYKLPLPSDVMNPFGDEVWKAKVGLTTKNCWQRQGAKTSRYSLAYGVDHRAISEAKDIDLLARAAGLDKAGVEAMAKAYLDSKPKLVAWKRRVWNEIYDVQEVRTPSGRRKRLFISADEYIRWKKTGRPGDAGKQGLNHLAQGEVASQMNRTIIAIKRRWPESRLGFQSHDGYYGCFPETTDCWPEIRGIVEREWQVTEGRSIFSTAEFERINSDGTHEGLH